MKIPEGQTPREVADLIGDIIKDKIVCDIGCGEGNFMLSMARYARKVKGIEEEKYLVDSAVAKGFEIFPMNFWFQELPSAEVYYSWTKDSMGVYLKAKHEGTKGIFIFGHSERPSTKKFLEELVAEKREINGFKVYITKL